MDKNLKGVLIFLLVLVVIFWFMPDTKIETIGDFFKKLVTPICAALGTATAIKKLGKIIKRKRKN